MPYAMPSLSCLHQNDSLHLHCCDVANKQIKQWSPKPMLSASSQSEQLEHVMPSLSSCTMLLDFIQCHHQSVQPQVAPALMHRLTFLTIYVLVK